MCLDNDDHRVSVKVFVLVYFCSEWLIILLNVYFICSIFSFIRNCSDLLEEEKSKYTEKLGWYPIVQICTLTPTSLNRFYMIATHRTNFWLMLVHVVIARSRGILFAVCFGYNSSVKRIIGIYYNRIFNRNSNIELNRTNKSTSSMEGSFISDYDGEGWKFKQRFPQQEIENEL